MLVGGCARPGCEGLGGRSSAVKRPVRMSHRWSTAEGAAPCLRSTSSRVLAATEGSSPSPSMQISSWSRSWYRSESTLAATRAAWGQSQGQRQGQRQGEGVEARWATWPLACSRSTSRTTSRSRCGSGSFCPWWRSSLTCLGTTTLRQASAELPPAGFGPHLEDDRGSSCVGRPRLTGPAGNGWPGQAGLATHMALDLELSALQQPPAVRRGGVPAGIHVHEFKALAWEGGWCDVLGAEGPAW